ncbi:hypothetical protein AsAng_0017050 [Aureispira anguillae]|uniref:Uncharacterized protein n=1 Tax=Aureispira anguillae TaxID=2864201 RepID=A0A915YDD1_9BACT|nr:hypothetical protein AsAng_0017050 [Aureispira anguillae]
MHISTLIISKIQIYNHYLKAFYNNQKHHLIWYQKITFY